MRRGFTLVELSIVLIVIGLLIGGILVAQSMISAARITSQIRQIQQVQIAVTNFKTKFGCPPGDCKTFTSVGDDDGRISTLFNMDTPNEDDLWYAYGGHEWISSFNHMAEAQMFPFPVYDDNVVASYMPGIAYPKMMLPVSSASPNPNKYPGGIVVGYEPAYFYLKAGHKIRLGACPATPGTGPSGTADYPHSFDCGITTIDALALDSKLDDGKPYSGDVAITAQFYIFRIPGSTFRGDSTGGCGTAATNSYRTDIGNCAIEFNFDL